MTAIASIARRAKELLETDGWCQGTYRDERGRRCLNGAMIDASFALGRQDLIADAFEALRLLANEAPSRWNDAPDRTVTEVLELLDRVGATDE